MYSIIKTLFIRFLGMVRRSERAVQRNLGLQHVFGTTLPILIPVHDIAIHVVYRTVFLSY